MKRLGLALVMTLALSASAAMGQTLELLGGDDAPFPQFTRNAGPREVLSALDRAGRALVAWRYVSLDEDVIALLGQDDHGHRETFSLAAGREYLFQAACDRSCVDVDLEIVDASGAVVANDASEAEWPVVIYRPAVPGRFTVRVWLKRCVQDYCYAGFRGYGRVD